MALRRFSAGRLPFLLFLCCALFVVQLGLALPELPSTKLMQDIICKRVMHLGGARGLLPEDECHGGDVQRELNMVSVGVSISLTVAAIIVTVPLGLLSDRLGRLPVLALSIVSLFLSQSYATLVVLLPETIPLRALWAMGAPLLIGGGRSVAEAMLFALISDSVPEENRAMWFQAIVGSIIAAQAVAPILAGLLMKTSIETPLWTSLALILTGGTIVLAFTPETLPPPTSASRIPRPLTFCQTFCFLFMTSMVYLIPAIAFTSPVASSQSSTLFRLMPVHFSWSLEKSSLLTSLRSLTTLVTLILALPLLSQCLSRFLKLGTSFSRDRILLRASALLFVLGSLLMIMISSSALVVAGAVISSCGSGIPTLTRSLLVEMLPGPNHLGSIFGVLAIVEVSVILTLDLGVGALFDTGLCTWIGLPLMPPIALAFWIAFWSWVVPHSPAKSEETFPMRD